MKWKPVDYIVAGLAIMIVVGMLFRLYGVIFKELDMSNDAARIIENMLSSVVAIISMYVGAKIQKHRDKDD